MFSFNSTKLEGDLQPTLGSLDQFLFMKIKIFRLFNVINNIFLGLQICLLKNKLVLIMILGCLRFHGSKKLIIGNMISCFLHH
jgi:hypothetical protein